ncbi:MAG: deoxyguanosinetriphosphate triphosphohydrolase, partial [Acutalibacteraceae bacterium]|nr:deoxyguanosinetriphosphate triphosphohydrolase [Acutalibacteraceae bacterium]
IVNNSGKDIIMDENIEVYYNKLHEYLFDAVYRNPIAKSEETKVLGLMEGLFKYFEKNTEKMSSEYLKICETEGKARAITDYIAGMTDHFAVATYENIYIPKEWKI